MEVVSFDNIENSGRRTHLRVLQEVVLSVEIVNIDMTQDMFQVFCLHMLTHLIFQNFMK